MSDHANTIDRPPIPRGVLPTDLLTGPQRDLCRIMLRRAEDPTPDALRVGSLFFALTLEPERVLTPKGLRVLSEVLDALESFCRGEVI